MLENHRASRLACFAARSMASGVVCPGCRPCAGTFQAASHQHIPLEAPVQVKCGKQAHQAQTLKWQSSGTHELQRLTPVVEPADQLSRLASTSWAHAGLLRRPWVGLASAGGVVGAPGPLADQAAAPAKRAHKPPRKSPGLLCSWRVPRCSYAWPSAWSVLVVRHARAPSKLQAINTSP